LGQTRSRLWLLVPALLLFAGLWVFLYKDALFSKPSAIGNAIGRDLPYSRLLRKDGQETTLRAALRESFEKSPQIEHILISFWATWCAPCVAELPILQEKRPLYVSKGLEIQLINFDGAHTSEDQAKVLGWLEDHAPVLSTLFDPQDLLIQGLEISALPFNAVVDRNLKWVWGDYGTLDFEKIEEEFIYRSAK
jgi:thiol-disulfide isomerase/thioredoxin